MVVGHIASSSAEAWPSASAFARANAFLYACACSEITVLLTRTSFHAHPMRPLARLWSATRRCKVDIVEPSRAYRHDDYHPLTLVSRLCTLA